MFWAARLPILLHAPQAQGELSAAHDLLEILRRQRLSKLRSLLGHTTCLSEFLAAYSTSGWCTGQIMPEDIAHARFAKQEAHV